MPCADRPRLACFLARALVVGRALVDLAEDDDEQRRAAWRRRKRWVEQVADGLQLAGLGMDWRIRLEFPLWPARRPSDPPWEPAPQPPGREQQAERLAILGRLLAVLLEGGDLPDEPGPVRRWPG